MQTRIVSVSVSVAIIAIIIIVVNLDSISAAEPLENGSFFAKLNGFTLHYEVHGSGPVLMTVPNSWGLSLDGLRALYRPLEQHVTLVYFDPRGMGGSEAVRVETDLGASAVRLDFLALREHLGLGRVNAIGWSNGATNLMMLASEHPEVFASTIFVHGIASFDHEDAGALRKRHPELFAAFAAFQTEMEADSLTKQERDARVKTFDTEVWFPNLFADPEAGRRRLPSMYRDTEFSWDHARYADKEWPTLELLAQLPRITARSLVITGRHDITPPAKGEEIASGIPNARHVIFDNSGHFSQVEEPEKFVELVVSFLDS